MAGSKETAGAYSGTGEAYKRDEMIHGIQIRKTKPVKPRRGRRKAGNGREIRHRCDQTGFQRHLRLEDNGRAEGSGRQRGVTNYEK